MTAAFEYGTHKYLVTPPDVITLRYFGKVSPEDMLGLASAIRLECGDWPRIFNIVDLRSASLSAEARKRVPEAWHWAPLRGTVIISDSFAMRTVGMLISRMVNVGRGKENPVVFVDDDQAALAWVDEQRRKLTETL